MSRFKAYSPDQAYWLPPSVKDELDGGHLCFFVQKLVERLDLSEFERAYSLEGGQLYAPAMMVSVWLYGYATGLTSGRELERRIWEELPLRYLAGGHRPDHWALSAFRRKHGKGINDVFTQVVEFIQKQGFAKLGVVAIDSTSIKANNSKSRVDTEQKLRNRRARIRRQIRRWQKQCDAEYHAVAAKLNITEFWLENLYWGLRQRTEPYRCNSKRNQRNDHEITSDAYGSVICTILAARAIDAQDSPPSASRHNGDSRVRAAR